jgi:predicted dehydrogenase
MRILAFVGCAHIHTPGFVKACLKRGVPVAATWDHDLERSKRMAAALGAESRSLEGILEDPSIEGLVVCSETNRHESLVMHLVDSGKALFVEKPLGGSARDALMIANAVEAADVPFQTGYRMRGEPAVRTVKRMLDEGVFGAVTRARASVCHDGALGGWFDGEWRWMADLEQAGVGAFGDLGTHGLDILYWLFGDVQRVTACLGSGTARYPHCDELGEGILSFKNEVIATLTASWDAVANPEKLSVCGTHAHASIRGNELFLRCEALGSDGSTPFPLDGPAPAGFDAFLAWAAGEDTEFVGVRAAAYQSVVMDALYRSASERQWIEIA